MKANKYNEFSEFELKQLNMKTSSDERYEECGAVGTAEEELEAKTVVKKYRGVNAKQRTKGTGAGTLKLSLHMNYEKYNEMFGKKNDQLKDGVVAYGQNSTHQEFALTALVLDEDDEKKLKAYPRCIITNNPGGKIENGGEEVAEIELEIAIMPDEHGYAMYEALYDGADEEVRTAWLESFTPDLVRVTEA